MNTHRKQALGGLAISLGLGLAPGCGAAQPGASTSAPQQIDAAITQSLDRLRALEIADVGNLVLKLPAQATACYGQPCPGSNFQPMIAAERARQAPRVARLADLAEQTSHNQYLEPRAASEADAAVKALADLQVVEVLGLVLVSPKNNPSCYNLPCAEDKAAADRTNSRHVTEAFAIAAAATASGL